MLNNDKRSRLDEIEDYHYVVDKMIYKDTSDELLYQLLVKRGLNDQEIIEITQQVKNDYQGVNFYLISFPKQLLIYFIDYAFLFLILIAYLNIPILNSNPLSLVVLFVLFFLYFLLLEMNYGATLGNYLTNTRVVNENYENPEAIALFFRTMLRLVPDRFGIMKYLNEKIIRVYTINYKKYEKHNDKYDINQYYSNKSSLK